MGRAEILLVDDDATQLATLPPVLEKAGYAVRTAADGRQALAACRARRPDLVLLDVMMPRRCGLDVCRELRAGDPQLPVVFLTALGSAKDELAGLASGGDLYIPKTTPDELLLARIAALLRTRGPGDDDTAEFDFADWHVRPSAMNMTRGGRDESLTELELAILRHFAAHPHEVFTRDALITRFWGASAETSDNQLSVVLYNLRRKLGRTGDLIVSVRSVGYAFRPS